MDTGKNFIVEFAQQQIDAINCKAENERLVNEIKKLEDWILNEATIPLNRTQISIKLNKIYDKS